MSMQLTDTYTLKVPFKYWVISLWSNFFLSQCTRKIKLFFVSSNMSKPLYASRSHVMVESTRHQVDPPSMFVQRWADRGVNNQLSVFCLENYAATQCLYTVMYMYCTYKWSQCCTSKQISRSLQYHTKAFETPRLCSDVREVAVYHCL